MTDPLRQEPRAGRNEERIEVYEDKAGRWRWRILGRNNEKTAMATQGYANFVDCVTTAESVTGYRLKTYSVDA